MNLDFHTHGKLAKKLPFSTQYTDWLFDAAKAAGLDALCLTEHFNTLEFDRLYRYLQEKSRRAGDTLVPSAMNLVSMWGVRITAAAVLAPRLGLTGVWLAMCGELCVRGLLFLARLLRERWLAQTWQMS